MQEERFDGQSQANHSYVEAFEAIQPDGELVV